MSHALKITMKYMVHVCKCDKCDDKTLDFGSALLANQYAVWFNLPEKQLRDAQSQ
jgi:hypothetical protein